MIIYLHDLVILFLITIFFFNIIKVWIVLMVYVSTNFKKLRMISEIEEEFEDTKGVIRIC
jgi:hypothetical protein